MSDECRYCLLSEPLLRIRTAADDRTGATLPEVLAGLAGDDIVSFQALQAHQRQAWYCFLVQLGAVALARDESREPPGEADRWRRLLLRLTDGEEAPWCLVVEDVSRPAFMQPPVPEGSLEEAGYKFSVPSPDELDMLVTAKNHDVKLRRMAAPRPEHWLYALVTLQTLEGFSGRGNYGIVRMNGGYGSRPLVGMTPALGWGTRFRRDVPVLVAARQNLVANHGYRPDGEALLWLLPWDGGKSSGIPLRDCDPLFVEICRRIRLQRSEGRLRCRRAATSGARVAASDDLNGVTGDPWTPIDKAESKALSVGAGGFSYDRLHRILLSGDYVEPAALRKTDTESEGGFLVATVLARGQGKTEGLHHRVVPIPANAMRLFGSPSERERLARRAEERVETAAAVQGSVLYPALRELLTAGSDENVDGEKIQRWTGAFDADVDDAFFPDLWASLDLPHEEARRQWQQQLHEFARRQLQDAIDSAPLPSIRRYRAISAAELTFRRCAHRELNELFPETQEEEDDRERTTAG